MPVANYCSSLNLFHFLFASLFVAKLCARIKRASAEAVRGGQSSYAGLAEVHDCQGEKSLGIDFCSSWASVGNLLLIAL